MCIRDRDTSEYIREIGVRYNYSIVYINDVKSPFYTKTRPDEFLYWISHSKLVVTDSFHAIVFSIIFRKAFLAVNRSDGKNMQDRIDTDVYKRQAHAWHVHLKVLGWMTY